MFGLIDLSLSLETGYLIKDINNLSYYRYIELMRLVVLLFITYIYFINDHLHIFIRSINLIKFWFIIYSARITESSVIKYDIMCYIMKH